jgi:hypothetical protein
MRFVSTASRANYVVKPSWKTINALGQPEVHRGLRAKFLFHTFDTDKAQRELGWTDDERKIVEEYLLGHRDYDHPRGFYLEIVDGEQRPVRAPATVGQRRCIATIRNEQNEAEQCPALLKEDEGDYCEEHAAAAEAAMAKG